MNRVFKALAIAFTVVVALVSCKKEDQQKEVALTGIELNVATQALQVGQDFQLKVTYKPENATNKPEAVWSSDAPTVATVDAGKVVAVAAGTAKITAKVGTFSATCTVTVTSAEEEIVPVEGNSAWSVIGAFLDSNWEKDYVCAEKDGAFVLKNVKLSKDNQVKFRKDKGWDVNRGINEPDKAAELAANTPVEAIQGGGNIIIPADGIYDLYYFAEKEAIVYVAKDAALPEIPDFTNKLPEPKFPEWANIGEITNGNHTFKFSKDDNYAYFYSVRTNEGRFGDIWDGNGYIYFALDFDGDLSTGEELNGNGKYEYIGFIYCFGAKPNVGIVKPGDCRPADYTVENIIAQGSADDNAVTVEYAVPLADLPELPENFTIYTWGNKDMAKVVYAVPFVAPPYEHDYTPSAEYLSDKNLWKPAQDDVVIYKAGAEAVGSVADYENITAEQSTYKFHFADATNGDWTNIWFMYPAEGKAIPLSSENQYNFKITFYANKDIPRAFFKVVRARPDKGLNHEGEPIWEPATKGIKAGEPLVYEGTFFGKPLWKDEGQTDEVKDIAFTLDFGGNPADVDIYVKDITLTPVEGGDQTDYHDTFTDYTPSAAYLAETNLWKAVDANHSYDWAGMPATFEQSTYSIKLPEASDAYWSTQFRIIPNEDFIVYPASEKTYKFSCKIYSSTGTKVWIKMHPGLTTHWPEAFETAGAESPADRISVEAQETKTIEFLVNADNNFLTEPTKELLLFDLCPHNAENMIHIKDIVFEEVVPAAPTPTDFAALEDNAELTFEGIVASVAKNGVIVTDGTTNIYVFKPATTPAVGDKVSVKATKTTYYKLIETKQGAEVTVLSSGNEVLYTEPVDITDTFDAYPDTEHTSDFLSVTGELVVDGSYVNLNVAGATARQGSLQGVDITALNGKKIKLFGYYIGTSGSGGKFLTISVVSAEEVAAAPEVNITLDGNFDDWADVPGFESSGNTTKEWKFASDDENIYLYFKIVRSDVIASKTEDPAGSGLFPYNWRRYCTFIIDTDNDPTTGTDKTYKDLHLTGAEAWGLFYPFRGNATAASGTDGNPSVVNGVEEQGGVEAPSTDKVKVYGVVEADYAYLEAAIARSSIGSPASGKITVQVGLSYNNPDPQEVTLK